MKQNERRKYTRVKIYYPIIYCCHDIEGPVIEEMMGVAVDISPNGIVIESVRIVASEDVLLVSVDLEKNVIEHRGKVAYCQKSENGKYRIGINFDGTHNTKTFFVTQITRSYHYLRYVLHFDPSSIKRPSSF